MRAKARYAAFGCAALLAAGGWFGAHQDPGRHRPAPHPSASASAPAAPTASASTAPPAAAGTAPLPAALAGSHFVTSWTGQQIGSAPWNHPGNNPGNCPAHASAVSVNAAGQAVIHTTGQPGDCEAVQSPVTLPTKPGSVYEADVYFSSFADWPAYWMYGSNWPQDGEIDSVEGGPGGSSVTWHQAGNYTIGPDQWDSQRVALAPGAVGITAGAWHTVDIAFTANGVDTYYDGHLYVHIPETVTTGGTDPMWLTFGNGSCDMRPAGGPDVCNGVTSPAGDVLVKALRQYS